MTRVPPWLLCALLVACGGRPVDRGADAGPADAGAADAGPGGGDGVGRTLRDTFLDGGLHTVLQPRVSPAGLQVVRRGARTFTLALSVERSGREARALEVRDGAVLRWRVVEGEGERLQGFAVHPSGAVTLGVEQLAAERDAYGLVRLDAQGQVLHRGALPRPSMPPGDLPPDGGSPFAMKGVVPGAVVRGWVPWLTAHAHGEDVVLGVLSTAEDALGRRDGTLVSAVMALHWMGSGYTPTWARVVDRVHGMTSVAWQYDDFQWMDATARLLVVVDSTGVLVGRTVNTSRCRSLVALGEQAEQTCRVLGSRNSPHRYQPFAVTRFGLDGARLGTWVYAPEDLDELVVFGLASSGSLVALVGTEVRLGDAGEPTWYFEPPGATDGTKLSPYDGLLAVVRRDTGAVQQTRRLNLGRGERLAAVQWAAQGWVAAGASDWNRWSGGMSVSRGARPVLVLAPHDGGPLLVREGPGSSPTRHTHVLALDVQEPTVLAVGPADAPMTHSGDTSEAENALGGLTLELR